MYKKFEKNEIGALKIIIANSFNPSNKGNSTILLLNLRNCIIKYYFLDNYQKFRS